MKLKPLEKQWILYDVGNSAFTLLVSTIIPIYFNYLSQQEGISDVNYLAYWGYAASIATLIVAFAGPILGTIADTKGYKKPIFLATIIMGAGACALLGFPTHWLIFLAIFVIAKIGFSMSLIFYDSMLSDVTTEARMDNVSSQGFAWGYIGSCIPFIMSLILVLGSDSLGLSMKHAMMISFFIVALWWLVSSLPLLKNYQQIYSVGKRKHVVKDSFSRLGKTFKSIKKEKHIFVFLLAFFFYIDGVYTIINMATAYGTALGLDSTGLLLALLVTQIVAFPCAIIFGRLAGRFETSKLILVCILAYFGISIFAVFLHTQIQFWMLAILVGMFQGGIQALSRSYYAKIIPPEKSGEYFGILDICGKGASFVGTTVVSVVSQLTKSTNLGVGAISILFIVGIILFIKATQLSKTKDDGDTKEFVNDMVSEY